MAETLLCVDTSTMTGSVALLKGDVLLGEVLLNVRSTHSERLMLCLRQLLEDVGMDLAELDGFGVVAGPGSFTGLRIGMGTVKGLALATGKPVVPVGSLEALAMNAPLCRLPVCSMLDARKSEVYAGLFSWEAGLPRAEGEPTVQAPERLLESLSGDVLFVGDGALAYRNLILHQWRGRAHFLPGPLNQLRAGAAAVLGLARLRNGEQVPVEQLAPAYVRPSEAEIMWARRREEGTIEG